MESFLLDPFHINTVLGWPETENFQEFCHTLDLIDDATNIQDLVLEEAVETAKGRFVKGGSTILRKTSRTTKEVFGAVDDVTSGGGALIGSVWSLFMKLVGFAGKVIYDALKKMAHLINDVGKVVDAVTSIPSRIRSKIRGDIHLYFTAEDMASLANEHLMTKIRNFISTASLLASGDSWQVVSGSRPIQNVKRLLVEDDVMKCKQLASMSRELQKLRFTQTTISMKRQENVITYFSTDGKVTYGTSKGGVKVGDYYTALRAVAAEVVDSQKDMQSIQRNFIAKVNETQANYNMARMKKADQMAVIDAQKGITKAVGIIGNMVKCISSDINELYKNASSVSKRSGGHVSGLMSKGDASNLKSELKQQRNTK